MATASSGRTWWTRWRNPRGPVCLYKRRFLHESFDRNRAKRQLGSVQQSAFSSQLEVPAKPSYETQQLDTQFRSNLSHRGPCLRRKANRRMLNIEPQNYEGWNRCALSLEQIGVDRVSSFDIRHSMFDIRYSLLITQKSLKRLSLFFDQTGRPRGKRRR